jgi:hypothetical protein
LRSHQQALQHVADITVDVVSELPATLAAQFDMFNQYNVAAPMLKERIMFLAAESFVHDAVAKT